MILDEAIKHAEQMAEIGETYEVSTGVEEYRQLAEWLKELKQLREQTRWHPVSERLPEDGLYLVTTSKGQVQVHVFNHNGNSEEYWMRCNKAWMPLPEPYKASPTAAESEVSDADSN